MCPNTQGEKKAMSFYSAYCRTQMWQLGSPGSAFEVSTRALLKKLDSQNEISSNKYEERERRKGLVSVLWIKDRNSDL